MNRFSSSWYQNKELNNSIYLISQIKSSYPLGRKRPRGEIGKIGSGLVPYNLPKNLYLENSPGGGWLTPWLLDY